ncbi:MAG: ribulose-phosphate 3-epimerase [Clostridia bacterium]|jgi:ribulose-phosphate 3-epimerase|nr:ribulose-phosphate 3-epimerase [Clostridia bacterium]
MKKLLSASLMCADLTDLKPAIAQLEDAKIDYLHMDVMDGAFVPNITLGFDLINAVKKSTSIPLDVHMMVNEPGRFIDRMELSADDIICVHYESDVHIHRTLEMIKNKGCRVGLAINPQTPVESIKYLTEYIDMLLVMTVSPGFAGQKMFLGAKKKVQDARKLLDEAGLRNVPIEVDGNINLENGKSMCESGAEIFVLGTSALFLKDKAIKAAAEDFKNFLG